MSAQPNDLERAILIRLSVSGTPVDVVSLKVVSREITGAGSYTTFATPSPPPDVWHDRIGLDALIEVPGVANGLGAVLWMNGGLPLCLEIYTYGGDSWDGSYQGYRVK